MYYIRNEYGQGIIELGKGFDFLGDFVFIEFALLRHKLGLGLGLGLGLLGL